MTAVSFCFHLECPPQIVSCGGDVKALLGYSQTDFLSGKLQLQDRIHREDVDLAASIFAAEQDPVSGTINLRVRHSDGRIRCLRARFRKELAGKPVPTLDLILEDVRTVSEAGDTHLLASFQSLIEHTNDYILLKNLNHVILSASRSVPELAGSASSAADLAGKTDYDLHPETVADITYRLDSRALEKGIRVNEIVALTRPDGSKRWIDSRKYPINGTDGTIVGILGIAPDITDQIESRLKLRESEASLQQVQKIAGLGSYTLDIPAERWTCSEIMLEIFGISPTHDRTFAAWLELVHPDDRATMHAYFRDEVLGQRKPFDKEYRIIRRSDGVERWVHGLGELTFDAEGRPCGMRGTIQDITEQKRAEAALRESKELLQLFIDHAPAALIMMDRDLRYLALSRRFMEMESLVGRELIGHSHYEFFPQAPAEWKEDYRRALNGETVSPKDIVLTSPDAKMRWLCREVRPWYTASGEIGGLVVSAEDITEQKRAEEALRESKELLQLFIEHAPAAMAMLDRDMRYLATSRRWLEMHMLGDAEIVGRLHYEFFPGIPDGWREEHRRCLAGEAMEADERELTMPDGSLRWVRREILPWHAGDGSVGGIVILAEDVTERRQAEDRLRLAATVFTGAREGILITGPDATILEVNEAFTRITGYTREELIGKNPSILQSGLQSQEFFKNMWEALERDGLWSGEIWNRTKSGDIYPEMLQIHAIRDATGQVKQYVGLATDITEIKKQENQLELVTHYDVLTGLPNRALLADRMRQAIAQARRRSQLLAVAYFDLDGFKVINDTYGQASGDALLRAVAQKMKLSLHEGDTLARLGGDEFVAVILDLPDRDACVSTLRRMLAAASEEVEIGAAPLRVTASVGVAFFPQEEEVDADMLLRQAGQALYEAKLSGKNRVSIFDPSQDLITRSRLENIEHLRRALAANEFVLHYQPKVNMRTGKVIGAEALLRWQHPERGLLPPGMFLPVIEDHPLAVNVGRWVIESVLRQMEIWQESGFEIPVSINVSAYELQQPDFVTNLCAHLKAHPRIKPWNLELEVLETSALQNVALSSQVLVGCREAGVSISVDDFGTGYSSLAYLRRLPADELKIDQSFVRDMLDDPESLTILKGVLGLAEAFRRHVIAEGVETVDHGLMLLQLGCDLAQGYGIARPMPANELQKWAAEWRADPRWLEMPKVQATNRAALFAAAEHRAWFGHFLGSLHGSRSTPPVLDANQCGMRAWLDAQRLTAGGTSPSLQAIDTLHRQIHELASEIYLAHSSDHKQDGLGLLRQLRYLHERCLKRLQPFTRTAPQKHPRNGAHEEATTGANHTKA